MNSRKPVSAGFRNKKSTAIAYVLLIILGILGAHRFYLGHRKPAITIILLVFLPFLIPIALVALDVWAPPLGNDLAPWALRVMTFIWLIPLALLIADLFRIPGLVRDYNDTAP